MKRNDKSWHYLKTVVSNIEAVTCPVIFKDKCLFLKKWWVRFGNIQEFMKTIRSAM